MGTHGSFQMLVERPLPICHHEPREITLGAVKILFQQIEASKFTRALRNEQLGKYFAFRIVATKELGAKIILQP